MSVIFHSGCSQGWDFITDNYIDIITHSITMRKDIVIGKAKVLSYEVYEVLSDGFKKVRLTVDITEIRQDYIDESLFIAVSDKIVANRSFKYTLHVGKDH